MRPLNKMAIAETSSAAKITEDLLARVWRRQLVDGEALATADGRKIRIIQPGIENRDRGPDFSNALIAIDGDKLMQGDVEIHVRASDWRLHAHHRDPHYNRVILHVVWQHQSGEKDSLLESGGRAAILPLRGCLMRPPDELPRLPQPRQPFPQPCTGSLPRLGAEAIATILEKAGEERFSLKARQLEAKLTAVEPGQVLYEGLMEALGYTKNKEPFQKLAQELPLSVLEDITSQKPATAAISDLQALLLGTAGLLPVQRGKEDPQRWARYLEERWQALGGIQRMSQSQWRFFRVRPENFPTRRLAAASYLLERYRERFLSGMLELLTQASPSHSSRRLEQGLVVTANGYWAGHFDFARGIEWAPTLLGEERAGQIVINVLLPFFFAWSGASSSPTLQSHTLTLYRQYHRLGENWITRHLLGQIVGGPSPKLVSSAQRQQGLLHLYKTFCSGWECARCPLGLA